MQHWKRLEQILCVTPDSPTLNWEIHLRWCKNVLSTLKIPSGKLNVSQFSWSEKPCYNSMVPICIQDNKIITVTFVETKSFCFRSWLIWEENLYQKVEFFRGIFYFAVNIFELFLKRQNVPIDSQNAVLTILTEKSRWESEKIIILNFLKIIFLPKTFLWTCRMKFGKLPKYFGWKFENFLA